MILGTAGHIDHGKTTLVKALTGVDTDRLPEEKRRGITIVLGFAPLTLAGLGTIGVVDVPGHEAFVKTMVAGATGIDIGLLVIAADEGIMPQTREHAAILEHLGVDRGVVALTKSDLVDDDWLELVRAEVGAFLEHSALRDAAIIPVSATTGKGLPELRAELLKLAKEVPKKVSNDLFRLPIDRVFTVKGTGTVVTGTVWSGELSDGATVRVLPQDLTLRVRGLQNHNHAVQTIHAGDRAAIALAGVDVDQVPRGSVVVSDPLWQPTQLARAEITLNDAITLGPRTKLRFHVGTSDVGATITFTDQPKPQPKPQPERPGPRPGPRPGRLRFDQPIVLRAGDRFVLRRTSPLETIGGGTIIDPLTPRRSRPITKNEERRTLLRLYMEEAGSAGLDLTILPQRLGLKPSDVEPLVKTLKSDAVRVGNRIWSSAVAEQASKAIRKQVADHHKAKPLEKGAPVSDLRASACVAPELFDHLLNDLVASKKLSSDGGLIRQPGFSVELSGAEDKLAKSVMADLESAGAEPPSVGELTQKFGDRVGNILRFLERNQSVVKVEPDRYYAAGALQTLLDRLADVMHENREYSPAELREALGTSRKYLIPLLEYCDRRALTIRTDTGRRWRRNP